MCGAKLDGKSHISQHLGRVLSMFRTLTSPFRGIDRYLVVRLVAVFDA
jgi:hypothetical protein